MPKTVISKEFSSEWKPGDEPYYPVNDEKNGMLYEDYRKLADQETKVIFHIFSSKTHMLFNLISAHAHTYPAQRQ